MSMQLGDPEFRVLYKELHGTDYIAAGSGSVQESIKANAALAAARVEAVTSKTSTSKEKAPPSPHSAAVRTKINYVLVAYIDDKIAGAMPLPNQPAYKRVSKRPGQSIRYTLGDQPIREHTQDRAWHIDLGGMVGLQSRPYQKAFGGADSSASGLECLIQFDLFLASFHKQAEVSGSLYLKTPDSHTDLAQRSYLVLYDFDEGYTYRVEVDAFDWDRDRNTAVGNANWRLSAHGYFLHEATRETSRLHARRGLRKGAVSVAASVLRSEQDASEGSDVAFREAVSTGMLSQSVTEHYREEAKVLDAPGVPKSVTSDMVALIKRTKQPFLRYQSALEDYRQYARDASKSAQVPMQLIGVLLQSGEATLDALQEVCSMGYEFRSVNDHFSLNLSNLAAGVERVVSSMWALFGSNGGNYKALSLGVPGLTADLHVGPVSVDVSQIPQDGSPVQVTVHNVKDGETWQSIATHYLGDGDAWMFLAKYNGSPDGHSLGDGAPLGSGAKVLIPGVGLGGALIPTAFGPGDLFGTDIAFDFVTGDIDYGAKPYIAWNGATFSEADPDQVDFATVTGPANFKQALTNRVLTPRNKEGYGVFPFTPGEPLSPQLLALLLASLVGQFMQDPRVAAVRNVDMVMRGTNVDLDVEVQPIASAPIAVSTPLQ